MAVLVATWSEGSDAEALLVRNIKYTSKKHKDGWEAASVWPSALLSKARKGHDQPCGRTDVLEGCCST